MTNCENELIPITIDLVIGAWRLKDHFLWDPLDGMVTIEEFARTLCQDLQYPKIFEKAIVGSIGDQIQIYRDNKRKLQQLENIRGPVSEQRHLITLNLAINSCYRLYDQFEWDVSNPENSPETFARILANDLGLSRDLEVAVAHSIRTQLLSFSTKPELKLPTVTDPFRAPNLRDDFTPKLVTIETTSENGTPKKTSNGDLTARDISDGR
eukprot:TRINITY_DN31498_c0_g1_i2.p1 TRINITY_DN31498_c0_g1~~TRINITY_DN31498_c0_g1_i2.p1  ORF type:complete len:210 (-),score=28.85 TRINITY_DN31498_c0_g1_i2:262-891(-)